MGYRHYFYLADKSECEKVKSMNLNQILDYAQSKGVEVEDGYIYFNDDLFLNKKEIFEFGKLYWDDTAERIYSKGEPLFANEEVQGQFIDYNPYVVGKNGLLEAIKIYTEKVLNYYRIRLEDGADDKIAEHYEHSIFNLALLLKTIDFEKETLLFYGW